MTVPKTACSSAGGSELCPGRSPVLTRAAKELLPVLTVTLLVTLVLTVMTRDRSTETVFGIPSGLYVLTYDSTRFIEKELPALIADFTAEAGIYVNVVRTTQGDEALLRAAVADMPIDVVLVPMDLCAALTTCPNAVFSSAK